MNPDNPQQTVVSQPLPQPLQPEPVVMPIDQSDKPAPIIPSVVPAETNTVTPENPKKGSPLIIIVIIVVIVAVLAVVAYVFGAKLLSVKPTTTPTLTPMVVITPSPTSVVSPISSLTPVDIANWKTFTNEKYGFSFKYPQEYIIKTSDDITGATPFIVFVYPDNTQIKLLLTFSFDQAMKNDLTSKSGVATANPPELPNIMLGTLNYPVTKYLTEEGVPGYGSCMDTTSTAMYLANISGKLAVTIYKENETTCNPDGTQKIVKQTTDAELLSANQILSTFQFTGATSTP